MPQTAEAEKKIFRSRSYPSFRNAFLAYGCRHCPLADSRTHLVIDRGNPEAEFAIIGEAPGKQEDLTGKPFVGRAGRLLDELFNELGLDTNRDFLVTNILKCRPPGNRPPRPSEVKECMPYLKKQMDLLQPRFALLFGATAVRYMLDDGDSKKGLSMKERVGRFFEAPAFPGIRFQVLYHPAFLLRNPPMKKVMKDHLQLFRREAGL